MPQNPNGEDTAAVEVAGITASKVERWTLPPTRPQKRAEIP